MFLMRLFFRPGFTLGEFIFTTAAIAFFANMAAQEFILNHKSKTIARSVKVTKMINEALSRYYIEHKSFERLGAIETLCEGHPQYLPPYICRRTCKLSKDPHFYTLISTTDDTATIGIPVDSEGIARRLKSEISSLEIPAIRDIHVLPSVVHKIQIVFDCAYLEIDKEANKHEDKSSVAKRPTSDQYKKRRKNEQKQAREKHARAAEQRKKECEFIRKQEQKISDLQQERQKIETLYQRTRKKKHLNQREKLDREIILAEKMRDAHIKKTTEAKKRESEKAKSGWRKNSP